MKRKALHKLNMRNLAAGEVRSMEEAIEAKRARETAWRFDPDTARIFDIVVHPGINPNELRVDVNVIEPDGVNQHTRVMRNTPQTWASLAPMAYRAEHGLTDYTEGGAK